MNKNSSCIYCGEMADTNDHIPPKNLFKEPRPALITVPACKRCNSEASKDDEYFRNTLVTDHRIENHPEAKQIIEAFKRSIQRNKALGLSTSLKNNLREVSLMTPTGLYVGKRGALKWDFGRISEVLMRIVKGLFFHEFGYPLPSDCSISAHSSQEISQDLQTNSTVMKLVKEIKTRVTVGKDVFSYGCVTFKDRPNETFWMLVFFNTMVFFVLTTPTESSHE